MSFFKIVRRMQACGALVLLAPAAWAVQAPAAAERLHIDYFGSEQGYAVRGEPVTVLCVLRNVGAADIPDHAYRIHCSAISGLDYTSGETYPFLPALARNQAVAFRWRLAQTGNGAAVAGLLIEPTASLPSTAPASRGPQADAVPPGGEHSAPPEAVLAVIPRIMAEPRVGSRVVAKDGPPQAAWAPDEAWISNDRVALHVLQSDRAEPVLALNVRNGADWATVATISRLAELRSSEEGQRPWRQSFHWEDSRAGADAASSGLTLTGTAGVQWRVQIALQAERDTSAIQGVLRLTAMRTMRLYGVQLPVIAAIADPHAASPRADGSPASLDLRDSILPDDARVAADRRNGATFGVSWPATAPLPDGQWQPLAIGDPTFAEQLGVAWSSEAGAVILRGASLEFPFRIFAFAPSDTVKDALRFQLP